jgi:hypothetical protein
MLNCLVYDDGKIINDKQMHLRCWPFQWPQRCAGQYRWNRPMCHAQGYLGSHWMQQLGNYLLHIAPAAARALANKTTSKTYTYFTGRFDGHGNAPVRCHVHCPMEDVQGFTRNHLTLPSGEYYVQ